MTQDGEVYYINHKNKTTSWLDPRLDPRFGKGLPQNLCGYLKPSRVLLVLGTNKKFLSRLQRFPKSFKSQTGESPISVAAGV